MTLTPAQKEICDLRLKEHQHEDYKIDLVMNPELTLNGFSVMKSVFRPETTSGYYLAKYLAQNKDIYANKTTLDMCCGTGIQGIVMGSLGAKSVYFTDISDLAVANARKNISQFGLEKKATSSCGDLFENVSGQFDVIVCNHPFFDESPDPEAPITRAWFNPGELLSRFLTQAPEHLASGGKIIMPYFTFAGDTNNPEKQAAKHHFAIQPLFRKQVDDSNIQKGEFCIYQLNSTK